MPKIYQQSAIVVAWLTFYILYFVDVDDTLEIIFRKPFSLPKSLICVPFPQFFDTDGTSAISDYHCYVGNFAFRISPMSMIHRQSFF
jgi:hypothetical protein